MKEFFEVGFNDYARVIVFLHILSAIVWIGGMIALRVVVHPSLAHIQEAKVRLARSLEIKKRFFNLVIPFILLLILTSLFMNIGMNFKGGDPRMYLFVHIKEAVWVFMTLVFTYVYIKRNTAERIYLSGDLISARENINLIDDYLIPLNIFLGIIALILGIVLRGF